MHCRKIKKWLLKNPESLSSLQHKRLDDHIKNCKKCAEEYKALSDMKELLPDLKNQSIPSRVTENFWGNIHASIQSDVVPGASHPRRNTTQGNSWRSWAIPSLAGLCILLIFLLKPWGPAIKINQAGDTIGITIESAEIDGQTANIAVFEMTDPNMTFIWLEAQTIE